MRVKVADCLPAALFSEDGRLSGIFHISWQGFYLKMTDKIIELFKNYQKKIYFLLLPSIEQKCYPVDFSLYEKFKKVFARKLINKVFLMKDNKYYLDLRKGVREILNRYFLKFLN